MPSNAESQSSGLPENTIAQWQEAGAIYGSAYYDWSDEPSVAKIREADGSPLTGLPTLWIYFSTVPQGAFASLPVPASPFGLIISGGCYEIGKSLGELARFRETLQELSLWGADIHDADLPSLHGLAQLRSLNLAATPANSCETIRALRGLPMLSTLRISLGQLGVEEAKCLSELPELTHLQVAPFKVTAEGLAELVKLDRLQKLELEPNKFEPGAQAALGQLRALRAIYCSNKEMGDETLTALGKLPQLAQVKLVNAKLTDTGLHALAQLQSLTDLCISGNEAVTAQGLAAVAKSPILRSLDASRTPWNAACTDAVASMAGLEELQLSFMGITDDDAAKLSKLQGLRRLIACDSKITDAGAESLKQLTNLTYLSLYGARALSDAGLKHLSELQTLQKLDIRQSSVTDAGIAALARHPALESIEADVTITTDTYVRNYLAAVKPPRSLHLQHTQITDAGLAHLSGCRSLKELNLETTKISDAGLAHLTGLTELRSLKLCNTALTDRAFDVILHFKKLTALDLSASRQMTFAGIKRLAELPRLKTLLAYSLNLSESQGEELRKLLPRCSIEI